MAYSPRGSDAKSELLLGLHNELDELDGNVRARDLGVIGIFLAVSFGWFGWVQSAPLTGLELGFLGTVGLAGIASLRFDVKRRLRMRKLRRLIGRESALALPESTIGASNEEAARDQV